MIISSAKEKAHANEQSAKYHGSDDLEEDDGDPGRSHEAHIECWVCGGHRLCHPSEKVFFQLDSLEPGNGLLLLRLTPACLSITRLPCARCVASWLVFFTWQHLAPRTCTSPAVIVLCSRGSVLVHSGTLWS